MVLEIQAERNSEGSAGFLLWLDFGVVAVEDIHRGPLDDRHGDTGYKPLALRARDDY